MPITVSLTTPKTEKSRAELAVELLRSYGYEEFAEDLIEFENYEIEPDIVYSEEIEWRLWRMAEQGGFFCHLWLPVNVRVKRAKDLIAPLYKAITWMNLNQSEAKQYQMLANDYDKLLHILHRYLAACEKHPTADVNVASH